LPVDSLKAASTSSKTSTERVTVFYGILLLLMLVNQYGYWLLLGVVEEKSTRVVEVLLATIGPDELLVGKTAGIGVLALGQGLAIVAVALGVGAATGSDLLQGAAPTGLLVALLWFVLGYLFYCSLYAAGGSLASRTEDAQNIGFPLQIPLLIAYFASFSALFSGSVNPVIRVMAFLPPTAPIAMPVLVATGHAGPGAIALSVAFTIGGAVLLMRVAGKIYRRAILRTGQRVKVREVLRRRSTP
jgi:ABC-2 type transport system permease protein